jgi:hypothetical protein
MPCEERQTCGAQIEIRTSCAARARSDRPVRGTSWWCCPALVSGWGQVVRSAREGAGGVGVDRFEQVVDSWRGCDQVEAVES